MYIEMGGGIWKLEQINNKKGEREREIISINITFCILRKTSGFRKINDRCCSRTIYSTET